MKARPLPSSSHPSRPPPLLAALLLLAAVASGARASPAGLGVDVDEGPSAGAGGGGEAPAPDVHPALYEVRWADALLWGVMSWNVMVVTLEVNDFRQHLLAAYGESPAASRSSDRYAAALFAVRLGLRDALVDWAIMYSIGYAVMAAFTYNDADPKSILVFLGFGLMFSAALLALCGLKIPQWLGFYRRSRYQVLNDTSDLAPGAARDYVAEKSSLAVFRRQVRLGVGKHFSQFACSLLPLYVGLRAWAYLLSVLLGTFFGHGVLWAVFQCRRRFRGHRGSVALGASAFVSSWSALVFTRGVFVVEEGWQRKPHANKALVYSLSFFSWLVFCLLAQGLKYLEHRKRSDGEGSGSEEDVPHLFEDETTTTHNADEERPETFDDGAYGEEGGPSIGSSEEPLLAQRDVVTKVPVEGSGQSYFYQSGYFDRVKLRHSGSPLSGDSKGGGLDENGTPKQIYDKLAAHEQSDTESKWYDPIWNLLPFGTAWTLFVMGMRDTFGCCAEESKFKRKPSPFQKGWFVIVKVMQLFINMLAIFVAIVACGATFQRKVTIAKLPHPREKLYGPTMNEGQVCAFDQKCGSIRTFPSNEEAGTANYTVAHCGPCGTCSNWNDIRFQPTDLATPARNCGGKNFFGGASAIQECIEQDIGFTQNCALDWAKNVACSRRHCAFIFIQSFMTNQVGNFRVDEHTITSATCSEASCEAGNPGDFVLHVGANRRRMNIQSEIARPADQQCAIVGIPKDSEGFSDWNSFMDPPC